MSDELKVITYDCLTSEQTERPFTEDELAQREVMQAEIAAQKAEVDAKVEARKSALAKLAKLGLTADEVAAL